MVTVDFDLNSCYSNVCIDSVFSIITATECHVDKVLPKYYSLFLELNFTRKN